MDNDAIPLSTDIIHCVMQMELKCFHRLNFPVAPCETSSNPAPVPGHLLHYLRTSMNVAARSSASFQPKNPSLFFIIGPIIWWQKTKRSSQHFHHHQPYNKIYEEKKDKSSTTERLVGSTSSMQKYVSSALEPILRRLVREEVERRLIDSMKKELHRSPWIMESSPITLMQLSFTKPLPLSIYSKANIKDRDNNTLQIELVRPIESSMNIMPHHLKVEIVVLDGEFPAAAAADDYDWTSEDFESHIVKERKGKRPLLVGDCKVTILQGSPASVLKLEFTDNSSWVRSRQFRLGARVGPESNRGPIRIKEAITDRFTVLDHRGELNKKHHPPSLDDRVWRLKNIGKNGIFDKRLADAGITTVQDLLKLSMLNMQRLREIMGGGHGISDNTWEATISHARSCEMGKEVYLYHSQLLTLVLTPICQVKGVIVNGCAYPLEQLSPHYTLIAERLVQEAYTNWDKLEKVDETSLTLDLSTNP